MVILQTIVAFIGSVNNLSRKAQINLLYNKSYRNLKASEGLVDKTFISQGKI